MRIQMNEGSKARGKINADPGEIVTGAAEDLEPLVAAGNATRLPDKPTAAPEPETDEREAPEPETASVEASERAVRPRGKPRRRG